MLISVPCLGINNLIILWSLKAEIWTHKLQKYTNWCKWWDKLKPYHTEANYTLLLLVNFKKKPKFGTKSWQNTILLCKKFFYHENIYRFWFNWILNLIALRITISIYTFLPTKSDLKKNCTKYFPFLEIYQKCNL